MEAAAGPKNHKPHAAAHHDSQRGKGRLDRGKIEAGW
jgi:hypothetical protein